MTYNLELERVIKKVKQAKAKKVCIQLPDGLKPEAEKIQKAIAKETYAEVFIWLDSCFGACDIPLELENIDIDLLIQWGHSEWKY